MDTKREHAAIPMDYTDAQEAELIKQGIRYRYLDQLLGLRMNPDVVEAISFMEENPDERLAFTENPEAWAAMHFPSLSREDILLVSGRSFYCHLNDMVSQ